MEKSCQFPREGNASETKNVVSSSINAPGHEIRPLPSTQNIRDWSFPIPHAKKDRAYAGTVQSSIVEQPSSSIRAPLLRKALTGEPKALKRPYTQLDDSDSQLSICADSGFTTNPENSLSYAFGKPTRPFVQSTKASDK